jgi:hypothetical protein
MPGFFLLACFQLKGSPQQGIIGLTFACRSAFPIIDAPRLTYGPVSDFGGDYNFISPSH